VQAILGEPRRTGRTLTRARAGVRDCGATIL
jgi:hypothetical protein